MSCQSVSEMMSSARVEVFYSKRDLWASFMVWGIALACAVIALQIAWQAPAAEAWGVAAMALLAGAGAPWFALTTRYRLDPRQLVLLSGPFFKHIDYRLIQSVCDGRGQWGLSFAFSRDCLQIDVSGSRLGYRVSPRQRAALLGALAQRCTHQRLVDGELLPHKRENGG